MDRLGLGLGSGLDASTGGGANAQLKVHSAAYALDTQARHGLGAIPVRSRRVSPHLAVPAQNFAAERVGHVVAWLVGVYALPVDVEIVEVPLAWGCVHVRVQKESVCDLMCVRVRVRVRA